ncbi:MAG: class I SAM-dependent methyltransferase [Candidatus Omnitrophica bacterium]|nr:class I SAM-dependent methyltransferase [Candidatus Omnitrophota bacterium]
MDEEALKNQERYAERKALYQNFGYDIDKERGFVIEAALPVTGKILEAGTGKGHFALLLARAGFSFTTFDISKEEQDFARLNLRYFGLERFVDFRLENGEALSFADKSFDAIFSVNTLHHLCEPYQVINELLRVLAPDGKLILSDFTDQGFAMMEKIHAREGGKHDAGKTRLADVQKYLDNQDFETRIAKTQFQEVLIAVRKTP